MICEDKQSLISLLTSIIQPQSNEDLKRTESTISSMSSEPDFIDSLLMIACNNHHQNNVRLLSCTYLNKHVDFVLNSPRQHKIEFIQRIAQFSKLDAPLQLRRTALQALTTLFNRDKTDGQAIRQHFYKNLLQALSSLDFNSQIPPQTVINLAICSNTTLSVKYDQISYQMVRHMMVPWTNILAYTYQQLKIHIGSPNGEDFMKWLAAGEAATQVFKKCFSNEDFPRNDVFKQLLASKTLFDSLNAFLELRTSTIHSSRCLIQLDGSNQGKYINQMKGNMLTVLHVFLKCSLYLNRRNPQQTSLYLGCPYANIFINTFDVVSALHRINQISCGVTSRIVHLMLLCLSTIVEIPQHYDYFISEYSNLLVKVVIPFYEPTNSLRKEFIEDPQQYIAYIEQSFQRSPEEARLVNNEQDVLHYIVSKLLMKLCLFLDGVLSQVVAMCINQLQNSVDEIKALMIIGVLSSKITERKDILKRLFDYFQLEVQLWCQQTEFSRESLDETMTMSLKLLVLSKFVCYFSQFNQAISSNIQEVCQNILQTDQTNSTFSIVSLILLGSLNLSNSPNRATIIGQIVGLVNSPRSNIYVLSSLLDYIRDFNKLSEYPQLAMECVNQLVIKICAICSRKQEKNVRQCQIHCWNIIKQIAYTQNMSHDLLLEIQKSLDHTIRFLAEPKQFDFEEDLLIILIRCVNTRKAISQTQKHFIQYIPHIVQKYKGSFHRLFQFIMAIFHHGQDTMKQQLSSLNTILDVCLELVVKPVDKYKTEVEVAKALLIIHNMLLMYHDQMSKQLHLKVVQTVYARLTNQDDISHCFLQQMYAATLCLSLSLCILKIQDQPLAECALNMVLDQCRKIEKVYPRKVYVNSLCRLVRMLNLCHLVNKYFLQLFYNCITTAYKTEEIHRLHEDDCQRDDEVSGDEDKSDEEEDYDLAVESTQNAIKKSNQFYQISTIIMALKTERPTEWASLLSQLSEQTKEQIRILARVKLFNNKPRQIIKIKR